MDLTLEEVARWTGGELHLLPHAGSGPASTDLVHGYSIDSRTIQPGELFFAVHGEKYDAHDFVPSAFERGARAAVVAAEKAARWLDPGGSRSQSPLALVVVDDPLAALQRLASAVRRHWNRRVIGITGSAGKTTTKEAVAEVLSSRFHVLKSEGNLNNAFGLPLQLLKLEPDHEIAVIEMGMSHAGEISALARVASPDWGVVTNVGNAHAGNFSDGVAGVARAKYELIQALPTSGTAFLNCDDPYVSQFGRDFHGQAVYFGSGACANPRSSEVEDRGAEGSRFAVTCGEDRLPVTVHLVGRHNVQNALAAIAVGVTAGISLQECAAAVGRLRPSGKRSEVLQIRGATVINDCYNSNPEALRAMITALAAMPAERHILVAGEMLELGADAKLLHRQCGEFAARSGIDLVIGVQGNASELVEAARQAGTPALYIPTPEDAGRWLQEELREGDAVLLKASRGVALERALAWTR